MYRVLHAHWSQTGVAVIMTGPPGGAAAVVLKLPGTREAHAALLRHQAALAALHADERLRFWSGLPPLPLAAGTLAGQPYLAEPALPGRAGSSLLAAPATRAAVQTVAGSAIAGLHQRTGALTLVDQQTLARWVDHPLSVLRDVSAGLPRATRHGRSLDRLRTELHGHLAGRPVRVGWIHGDYWPGNLLLAAGGTQVTGIVDWDRAAPGELPEHDLLHLLLFSRALVQGREPGEVVRDALEGAPWASHEQALLATMRPAGPAEPITLRAAILLYWLRFVAANLEQQAQSFAADRLWLARNVETVLRCF